MHIHKTLARITLALSLTAPLLAGTVPQAVAEDAAAPAIDAAKLASMAEDIQVRFGVTGLLIGVQQGDHAPEIVAAGTSLPGMPVTTDMHARIGAMGISTLTTILFQLVDEGAVTLDTPLATWFPDIMNADKVTIGMLACSRSGYADYVRNDGFVDAYYADVFRTWTIDELLAITYGDSMLFEPGTNFAYSHANFILLGLALESITGTTMPGLVQSRVLGPLGLTDIAYRSTPELSEPVLASYTAERGVFENATYWNPSWTAHTGALSSNVADLLGLTHGLASGALISAESLEVMLSPINVGDGFSREGFYYGYGILVAEPWIMQTFNFAGYDGTVAYRPDQDITIAVVNTLGATLESGPSTTIIEELKAALAP